MRALKQGQAYTGKFELSLMAMLLFFILGLPILILAYHHVAVSPLFEEATGFRYFYSLRILYSGERPWLPQGQLPGIINIGIQYVLTACGYVMTKAQPRIDIFSYVSAIIPMAISAIVYFWAALPLRTISARFLLACAIISTTYAYSIRMFFPFWNTVPDYMNWFPIVSILAIGVSFRLLSSAQTPVWNFKNASWLGVFLGVSIAIKVTLFIFPFTLACMMLFQDKRFLSSLRYVFQSFIMGCVLFIIITWVYYLGNIEATLDFFPTTLSFMQTSRIDILFKDWLLQLKPISASDFTYFSVLLPAGSLLLGVFNKKCRILLSTLPGSLLYLILLFKRFYWVTILEVQFFSLFLVVTVVFLLSKVMRTEGFNGRLRVLFGFFLLAMTWHAQPLKSISSVLQYYQQFNTASEKLTRLINTQKGVTAILGCDNNHRLSTVQTAICKGGVNIHTYAWGDSPFVKSMFPKLECYMAPSSLTHLNFTSLAFIRLPSENHRTLFNTLEKAFHIHLKAYNCTEEFPAPLPEALKASLVFCEKL